MPKFSETIALVEANNTAIRTVEVTQRNTHEVIERLHVNPLHPDSYTVRMWRCTNNERDLTGQMRIFREVLPEPEPEPSEDPIFQDMKIKKPIDLYPTGPRSTDPPKKA